MKLSPLLLGMVLGATPLAAAPVDFAREILPLLSDNCFHCHGPSETGRKAGLRLDLREGALRVKDGKASIVPGKPDESELVKRLYTSDPEDLMPPPESHRSLTPAQKDLLKRWVAEGAVWGKHWAFEPVKAAPAPAVSAAGWARNDLDRFIQARLESEGMKPSEEAALPTLARRVALDLVGLPPAESELERLASEPMAVAYETYVDRLLASPAFGERMASEWLDLSRYADTYGFQADVERDLSPWRDWVVDAINRNLPYDQFLLWQIAGDLLPGATQEQRLATAYSRLHRQTNEGGSIEEEWRSEYVSDRVHTVGTSVLGLTMECSRCHDHKYDPISQRDYYALSAFFNNIDESGLYSHFTAATPTPTMFLYKEGQEARHEALKTSVDQAWKAYREAVAKTAVPTAGGGIELPKPVARYAFDGVEGGRSPNAVSTNGAAEGAIRLVSEGAGKVLEFDGDDAVVCKGVGRFGRSDPFSIGLRVRPAELKARAVVFHRSTAWTDSGSRGYELVLDAGRPFFALIHFWPGNALAVRAKKPLPVGQWSHVTVTYDGSSRAAGAKIYVDGEPVECEVVRDNLYKDIRHRGEWGDSDGNGLSLSLGARFRDNGFRKGQVDDLEVYDLTLTSGEVARVAGNPRPWTEQQQREWQAVRRDAAVAQLASEARRLTEEEDRFVTGLREIMAMREMPGRRPTFVLARGAYDAPGAAVDPGVPEKIFPFGDGRPLNRLGFAQWLIDRQHPLTARVVVNRIWKHHFGRGLVPTVEDFGMQGRAPSHPELLDWLAHRFMASGWDRKALHRLIVTSATYRQATVVTPEMAQKDPENILLGRGPRHRWSAEVVRDRALAVSGLLVGKMGGRSVKPYQPAGVWEESGTGKTYTQDHGEALYRRSLYTFWRRTAPPPSMLTFDAPSREVCTAKREATATPMQALVLLNDPQFLEAARVIATSVWTEAGEDRARARKAFRRVIGREAAAREEEILLRLLSEQRAVFRDKPESATKYVSIGEFPRSGNLPPEELAAATVLVSALMNHDEFVTKR